jgi:phosphopentomutase
LGAGVLTRRTPELARGAAIASEITNDGWRQHLKRTELPVIAPAEAGRNLARIAAQHDLTLFAHYATDEVGHRGHMYEAVDALQNIDEFLGGVLAAIPDGTCIAIVSDHG